MITYKNLQDFIQLHKNELKKDTVIGFYDKRTNNFQVIRSSGNLNVSSYSFYAENGEELFSDIVKPDGTGVIGMMGHSQVSFKIVDSLKTDNKSDFRDLEHNVQFDRIGFLTVQCDQIEDGRFDDSAPMVAVGFQDAYYLIDSVEILHQPKYTKSDSWSHKSEGQYQGNLLAFVVGDKLKQEFNSKNESQVIEKFEDFIKKNFI